MNKAFIGIISYLGKDVAFRNERIQMHFNQLADIQYDFQQMHVKYGEENIPIVRVEQEWDDSVRDIVTVKELDIESIETPRLTPGAARNILLRRLYESDFDWLICTDDDHWIYPKYHGSRILWELSKGNFQEMAENAMAFSAFPSYWYGFQKDVDKWGKIDTHWLFLKTKHAGAMPLCCIPNLRKFGYSEIYFNEDTDCAKKDSAPEDLQFYIDWVVNGGKWLESMCLIAKSEGDLNNSSLFLTPEDRKVRDRWLKDHWRPVYLRSKYPTQPDLWRFREFSRRKNPHVKWEVEKYWKDV